MAKIKQERAWLTSNTPSSLLSVLKGKRVPRQRRQIAVACCRRVMTSLEDPKSRHAIDVAQRFLDGEAGEAELEEAFLKAQTVAQALIEQARESNRKTIWDRWRLAYAAQLCAARTGMEEASLVLLKRAASLGQAQENSEKAALCAIIRDVVGNPFREPPKLDPGWLAWNGGAVGTLARTNYEENCFGDMPVLADALEDAGCAEPALLSHCRSGGMHVRGCWVIELLLGAR
jgi:hypothetical protein